MTRAGVPHVVPVNYAVVDGAVVVRTIPGTKLTAAELGEPVSFEVDGFDRRRRVGWSVTVSGRTELVTNEHDLERIDDLLDSWAADPTDSTVRVIPDIVYGSALTDETLHGADTSEPALASSSG